MLAGVFNMLGYLDDGLGDLDDSLLIQLIVTIGLWLWALVQLFYLQFVLDSNLMDSMTEIDHFHGKNYLSCFQVLTPKNKT